MINPDDSYEAIADDLADAALSPETVQGSRFNRMMRSTVTDILMKTAIPWLERCFLKYSEADFHEKVLYERFDFIQDWKDNHYDWYYDFVNKARNRAVKRFIDFDVPRMTDRVVRMLQRRGWTIYPQEYDVFYNTVLSLRKEIYGY